MLPYDEAGSGPAVILLHAGVADRSMWSELLPGLAEDGLRAIAVDLPGFGEASVEPGPQAPWNDVLMTMNELGIERAALVGTSFGASVALRVAMVAPGRVSALVLASTPMPADERSPGLRAAWAAEEEALERGDAAGAARAVAEAWAPAGPLRERVEAMQRRAFELQLAAAGVEDAPDPADEDPDAFAKLSMPVLVVAGANDFPDFLGAAEELARAIPGARRDIVPDAGHLVPLEAPERFRELVRLTLQ